MSAYMGVKTANINAQNEVYETVISDYCKKLSSLKRLLRTTSASRRSKTANIKKDITLQHIAKMSLCSEVISSFLIFAVLDLREAEVVLKKRFKLLSFFTIIFAVFLHDLASVYQMSSKRGAKISKVGHVTSTRPI